MAQEVAVAAVDFDSDGGNALYQSDSDNYIGRAEISDHYASDSQHYWGSSDGTSTGDTSSDEESVSVELPKGHLQPRNVSSLNSNNAENVANANSSSTSNVSNVAVFADNSNRSAGDNENKNVVDQSQSEEKESEIKKDIEIEWLEYVEKLQDDASEELREAAHEPSSSFEINAAGLQKQFAKEKYWRWPFLNSKAAKHKNGWNQDALRLSPSQFFILLLRHSGIPEILARNANHYAFKHRDEKFVKKATQEIKSEAESSQNEKDKTKTKSKRTRKRKPKKSNKTQYTWRIINQYHIICWILVKMQMAITPLPTVSMYWNQKYGNKNVQSLMSRNLYVLIERAICAYDCLLDDDTINELKETETDNSWKCRELMEKLNETCLFFFKIGIRVALDESIVPLQNRTLLQQTFRNKPVTHGCRIFRLANEYGYVLFSLLDSQNTRAKLKQFDRDIDNQGGKIVLLLLLLAGITGKLFTVLFTDTYYTSIRLTHLLACRDKPIFLNGTLRKNAADKPEDCSSINGKSMERGDIKCHKSKDNKLFLATMFDTKLFSHITSVPSDPSNLVPTTKHARKIEDAETLRLIEIETELEQAMKQYKSIRTDALRSKLKELGISGSYQYRGDIIDRLYEHHYPEIAAKVKDSHQIQVDINKKGDVTISTKDKQDSNENFGTSGNNDTISSKSTIISENQTEESEIDYNTTITKDVDIIHTLTVPELKNQLRLRDQHGWSGFLRPRLIDEIRRLDGTTNVNPKQQFVRKRGRRKSKSSKKAAKKNGNQKKSKLTHIPEVRHICLSV